MIYDLLSMLLIVTKIIHFFDILTPHYHVTIMLRLMDQLKPILVLIYKDLKLLHNHL